MLAEFSNYGVKNSTDFKVVSQTADAKRMVDGDLSQSCGCVDVWSA